MLARINMKFVVSFSELENHDYRVWYYGKGYKAPDSCDYSQNCHGYAFGTGNWPATNLHLINGGETPCWTEADPEQKARVSADLGGGHTIKIDAWHQCKLHGNNGKDTLVWFIRKTSEQFRESGTFSMEHRCGMPRLSLWERHSSPPVGTVGPILRKNGNRKNLMQAKN